MKTISLVFLLSSFIFAQPKPAPLISDYFKANITAPPADLKLDPFYAKYTDALGLPITSSEKVPDAALLVARDIVIHMLSMRPDIRGFMAKNGYRVAIMAQTEMTTDLPEQRNWKKPALTDRRLTEGEKKNYERIANMTDKQYWDTRARGMGGRMTSCAEENLLGYPGTRYFGEEIFVHEFSHGIMSAIRAADPPLYAQIVESYKNAMAKGMWKNQYGSTTENEYWAEATQTWFWSNISFMEDGKWIETPDDLKAYDPSIYDILAKVYPDHHIPMDVFYGKNTRPRSRPQ